MGRLRSVDPACRKTPLVSEPSLQHCAFGQEGCKVRLLPAGVWRERYDPHRNRRLTSRPRGEHGLLRPEGLPGVTLERLAPAAAGTPGPGEPYLVATRALRESPVGYLCASRLADWREVRGDPRSLTLSYADAILLT